MTAQTKFFPLRGGLDQETPAIGIAPGRAVACQNHEAQPEGYQRTEGYERFDGQPAPSAAEFYTLTFTAGSHAFAAGQMITGNLSGATARVLDVAQLTSGAFAGANAAGTLAVHMITGTFILSENLLVGGAFYAVLATAPELGDSLEDVQHLTWLVDAQTYSRGLIQPVPGSGPVRGVLYYGDKLNAWRDSAGAGVLYHSSAAGWVATDLGKSIAFDTGGPYIPQVGDVVTGDQSGATATIRYVALDSGDWAFNDAAGSLILDNVVGTLGDETITTGIQAAFAHLIGNPVPVTFPAGGRYEFTIFNFFATESFERAYGANDVSKAFEFDGSTVAFISSGMVDDKPYLVAEHKNQLFLAFHFGSLQNSIVGTPRSFSGRLGAAELGMGHEITNVIPNTDDVMLVFTEKSMSALTGNDSSDFVLSPQGGPDAGGKAWTAQRIGQVIYLDNRGVRSAASTQLYGNFRLGTFTTLIDKELKRKKKAGVSPIASCVVKTKSQYLLFFDDGSGISIFFGLKNPEAMLFVYPFTLSCTPHVVEVDGVERIFVGAIDGYVYELNVGTSFDGDVIEAFVQLPYSHHGDPRLIKRYCKLELEMSASPGTVVGLISQFDGGGSEQPFASEDDVTVEGGGGLWGVATWGEFVWGAPDTSTVEFDVDGQGSNMSSLFVSRQSTIPSYTLSGVTVVFRGRGRRR